LVVSFFQIATTNAIVAGLQVLQAFHILKGQVERGLSANDAELVQDCRYVNCVRQPSRNGLFLIASKLEPPNPGCYVCRSAIVHVTLNVSSWTLQDWLDKVLKADLGFLEPALLIEGNVVYEEGEEDYVPNLSKKLQDLPRGGIKHGTVLLVEDYSQDMSVEIVVSHCEVWPKKTSAGGHGEDDDPDAGEDNPFRFMIGGIKPAASAVAASARNGEENQGDEDDDDDIIEVSEDPDVVGRDAKRPAESLDQKPASKKRKIQSHNVPADGNVIEID
jgi:ubiquitin-like 1-activating enzyme E1 B